MTDVQLLDEARKFYKKQTGHIGYAGTEVLDCLTGKCKCDDRRIPELLAEFAASCLAKEIPSKDYLHSVIKCLESTLAEKERELAEMKGKR